MSKSVAYFHRPKMPHSHVKSEIAVKYFAAWSTIVGKNAHKIAYLDLYAGRGQHKGGEYSTAVKILKLCSEKPDMSKKLVVILNDVKKAFTNNLADVINCEGLGRTNHSLAIWNVEVNDLIARLLNEIKMVPTFCFIDPYGYKGLTLELIKAVIKDWGSDCLIFFYTSGINRNLHSRRAENDMRKLFGDGPFEYLLGRIQRRVGGREDAILEVFEENCRKLGVSHFLPLRFNRRNSNRLSHHLIFLTKNVKGFTLMKDVMKGYSIQEDGIPLFKYIEGCENAGDQQFIATVGPMADLKTRLLKDYAGQVCTVSCIIDDYNLRNLYYLDKNIKMALKALISEKKIFVLDEAKRKGSLPDSVRLRF